MASVFTLVLVLRQSGENRSKTSGNGCFVVVVVVFLIFSFELHGKLNTVEALVNGYPRNAKKVSVNGAGFCFSKPPVTFRARKAVL